MPARRPIVAVVGLGTMGCGIAVAALAHGMDVRVVDADEAATTAGCDRLARRIRGHVESGLFGPELLSGLDGVVRATGFPDVGDGADVVVEAVPEEWDVKREVLWALSTASPAVLATNTSAFPVEELASSVNDPSRFLGVHFFNPAEWIPGVEVVTGTQTSQGALRSAMSLLTQMAKEPTVVASSPGFLANRLQLALFAECMRCVDEGLATPEDIDRVVRTTFGFRLPAFGPFAVADMAGLDVYGSILTTLAAAYGTRFEVPDSLRALLDSGRFGVKAGAGFATYSTAQTDRLIAQRDSAYSRLAASVPLPPAVSPSTTARGTA